jgi:hypothetical protein
MHNCYYLQAAELEKKEYDLTPLKESKLPIIWVLGKSSRMLHKHMYTFCHIDNVDIGHISYFIVCMRAQKANGSILISHLVQFINVYVFINTSISLCDLGA